MPDTIIPRTPTQETALLDYIERLSKLRVGRVAVHIRLSRLSKANRRAQFTRLAADMFSASVGPLEGQLYVLQNFDMVFVTSTVHSTTLNKAIDRLRALFGEDPIIALKESPAEHFCTWYRLEDSYDAFRDTAKRLLAEAERAVTESGGKTTAGTLQPIKPELLARIERSLEKADVTSFARRQVVCTIVENREPQPMFEEVYVSIADLQHSITPGVNWLADPWLFAYLSHTLDRRVMAMLMKETEESELPFSINLNVASVLSGEFRRFDEMMKPQIRRRLVIEFGKLDVFADMGSFLFARDYLHDRGYRVCLDQLTHLTLPYYNRAKLGFDLVKLFWMPDGIEDMLPEMIPAVRNVILEVGQSRTILCRCENARSIEIGQKLGIVMFQGRHVDRLHAAASRPGSR
jgi:hypothetical protein